MLSLSTWKPFFSDFWVGSVYEVHGIYGLISQSSLLFTLAVLIVLWMEFDNVYTFLEGGAQS